MPQSNKDNWPVTNSAAMLIPEHTTYTILIGHTLLSLHVDRFCLNRVMKDV